MLISWFINLNMSTSTYGSSLLQIGPDSIQRAFKIDFFSVSTPWILSWPIVSIPYWESRLRQLVQNALSASRQRVYVTQLYWKVIFGWRETCAWAVACSQPEIKFLFRNKFGLRAGYMSRNCTSKWFRIALPQ